MRCPASQLWVTPFWLVGCDLYDATSAQEPVPDFAAGLQPASELSSTPLSGKKIGFIRQTLGEGLDPGVSSAVMNGLKHIEALGASVSEVTTSSFFFIKGYSYQ